MFKKNKVKGIVGICAIAFILLSVVFGVKATTEVKAGYKSNILKCSVTLSGKVFECTGSEITPNVTVKYNNNVLTQNKDYELSYINNVNPGIASVKVKGKGDYFGFKIVNYIISKKKINVYSGNDNADGLVVSTVELYKFTAQEVINALANKGVMSKNVKVLKANVYGDTIVIDLSKDFQTEICNMGTAGEKVMLASLVNTFIDAYGTKYFELSIEGMELQTGHNIYTKHFTKYPMKF